MRLDLATEWRSRRWRRLLNLIDQLPRTSRYAEAMAQDDRLAEQLIRSRAQEPPGKTRRRMSDWSVQVELLTAILNRLGELTQAVAVLGGAKPKKVSSAPVPLTAFDRARERERARKHRSVVARVLPNKANPPV